MKSRHTAMKGARPWSSMYTKAQLIRILEAIGVKEVSKRLPRKGQKWEGTFPTPDEFTGHSRFVVTWGPKPDRDRLYNLTFS